MELDELVVVDAPVKVELPDDVFVSMMCSACEPQVLISGVTDVIVVRDVNSKGLISSPFYLCFGTDVTLEIGEKVFGISQQSSGPVQLSP